MDKSICDHSYLILEMTAKYLTGDNAILLTLKMSIILIYNEFEAIIIQL